MGVKNQSCGRTGLRGLGRPGPCALGLQGGDSGKLLENGSPGGVCEGERGEEGVPGHKDAALHPAPLLCPASGSARPVGLALWGHGSPKPPAPAAPSADTAREMWPARPRN